MKNFIYKNQNPAVRGVLYFSESYNLIKINFYAIRSDRLS